ncbi:MAG: hypothetical protein HFI31_10405 [Lachnospiraceae bacterium]|nr:hypothetical protein [Lachnospiraceae bacterium]MCI8996214.1 hypothetical protein [Lachnospiraceae bacterium]MCI9134585.1 hypothetical protein [Lachnospiraceae bacterium]
MNRMKYRVCLVVLVLAAAVFGVLYYVFGEKEQESYEGGTFVWYNMDSHWDFQWVSCPAIVLEPEKEVLL